MEDDRGLGTLHLRVGAWPELSNTEPVTPPSRSRGLAPEAQGKQQSLPQEGGSANPSQPLTDPGPGVEGSLHA